FWDNYNYTGREEAIEDCWKAQLAYWIQKDVVDTIAVMNAASPSVSISPVKRLVGISFTSEFKADTAGRREATATADAPRYVTSETEGILAIPWTGRKSNDEIDVVHFAVSVVVNNKTVGPFMKELCSRKTHTFKGWSGKEATQNLFHNQITILKSSIEPIVHTTSTGDDRYRYGDDAVVQLNLACEYFFSKAGYGQIKPRLISDKPAGADAGGGFAPQRSTVRPPKTKGGSGTKKKADEGEE
ncbi:MAG: hypothetical protein Q7T18_10255, partial [Sedimentisphaerales bacterium]|nr:hypothetical protein [Sedimentisphaerales bacterium]